MGRAIKLNLIYKYPLLEDFMNTLLITQYAPCSSTKLTGTQAYNNQGKDSRSI